MRILLIFTVTVDRWGENACQRKKEREKEKKNKRKKKRKETGVRCS